MTVISWFGHSAFKISSGKSSLLIDPFLDDNPTCAVSSIDVGVVDIVLVTHDHHDHTGQAVEICKTTGAMLGAVVETASALVKRGISQSQVLGGIGFNIGGTITHKGVHVTMIPAFHTSETGWPVGYIIQMPDGKTIYHAGDTSLFGDMAIWGQLYCIDVALLPIGGHFTMDARQAAMACKLLRCQQVIPMHWGTFPLLAQKTATFKEYLQTIAPDCSCIDMRCGEHVQI